MGFEDTWSLSIGYIIMPTLSCHIYEGHTDQNAPLSGKYTVDYLHISPNCQYILSSIFESHGSPKTILLHLKRRPQRTYGCKSKHLFLREQRSKYTSDDL